MDTVAVHEVQKVEKVEREAEEKMEVRPLDSIV